MAKERVIPLTDLEVMLEHLKSALDCGNPALVRTRLAEFIAPEQEDGKLILTLANAGAPDRSTA